MLNAFKYTKQLEEAGFSREQAEIQLQVIAEIVEGDLATKQDLNILGTDIRHSSKTFETSLKQDLVALEASLKQDMKTLEASLRQEMKTLDTGLRQEMKTFDTGLRQEMKTLELNMLSANQVLEYRITIKLGTLLIIGFTAMATLMKFWLLH